MDLLGNKKRRQLSSEAKKVFSPSSICKIGQEAVEGCVDEKDHSGFSVYPEGYFDPSESCAELERDQDHVDQPQD